MERINELEQENKKLNERIRFLEQCLDNKEKVNKSLREELNKDNREVQVDVDKELLKANDYLIKENKELKSDLKIWKLTAKDYAKQC
jgi:DNA gyrase/topoisomerase IV subunit A